MTRAARKPRTSTATPAKHSAEFSAWLDDAMKQAIDVFDRLQTEMRQRIEATKLGGANADKAN